MTDRHELADALITALAPLKEIELDYVIFNHFTKKRRPQSISIAVGRGHFPAQWLSEARRLLILIDEQAMTGQWRDP